MNSNNLRRKFSQIVEKIYPGARLEGHWPLFGGVSALVDALEVRQLNGDLQQVVVRRHKNTAWKRQGNDVTTIEYELHKFLFESGLPVPKVLMLDSSGRILSSPYFVMVLIEGETETHKDDLKTVLKQMAQFLNRLHSIDIESHGIPEVPSGEDPIKGALTYIPDTSEWKALRHGIRLYKPKDVEKALLHGDFWPGNILWKDKRITAVIDWEDASIGNIAADLACARIEIMATYGEPAMHTFTKFYCAESTREILDLPLWEVYSGFAALATMADWGLNPGVEAARRESALIFVKRAAAELLA